MSRLKRVSFILFGVLLASCASQVSVSPTAQPNAGLTPATTATETKLPATVTVSVTPTSTQTQTPLPTATANLVKVSLGQPVWIGRGQIIDAKFLPDNLKIAIGWGSGVSLNEVITGQEIWYRATPAPLIKIDIDPKGSGAAAILTDGSLIVFDVKDGEIHRYSDGSKLNAYWGDLAWSPDGKSIAYQFNGPNLPDPINIINLATGVVKQVPGSQITEGTQPVLTWSEDGKSITLPDGGKGCSGLIDVVTGEAQMRLIQQGQCLPLNSLIWTPGDKAIAIAYENEINLISFPNGSLVKKFERKDSISSDPLTNHVLFLDPEGNYLAARSGIMKNFFSEFEPITVWDLKSGQVVANLEHKLTLTNGFLQRVAATFDGESIIMFYYDGLLTRWDFLKDKEEHILTKLIIPAAERSTVHWSDDGRRLVFAGIYGGVFVWETATGVQIAYFDGNARSPSMSPDGNQIALFDQENGEQQVIDLNTKKIVINQKGVAVPGGAAFSPDGFFLAYSLGTKAAIVDLRTNQAQTLEPLAADKPAEGSIVSKLIWSPDGQTLIVATTGNDPADGIGGKIVLWQRNQNNFNEIFSMDNIVTGDLSAILGEFNPSGNLVAIQKMIGWESDQREIIIYNLVQHAPIQNFIGFRIGAWVDYTNLLAINFNLDNQLIQLNVTSGEKTLGKGKDINNNAYSPNGILYLNSELPSMRRIAINYWRTGETLSTGDHGSEVSETLWSPDGHWVGSVGIDGTVRAWPVEYRQ